MGKMVDIFIDFAETKFRGCVDTLRRKNKDYAGDGDPMGNFYLVENARVCSARRGVLVRMFDKMSRISTLVDGKDPAVSDEAIEDTLLDLINYAMILLFIIWREKNAKSDSN